MSERCGLWSPFENPGLRGFPSIRLEHGAGSSASPTRSFGSATASGCSISVCGPGALLAMLARGDDLYRLRPKPILYRAGQGERMAAAVSSFATMSAISPATRWRRSMSPLRYGILGNHLGRRASRPICSIHNDCAQARRPAGYAVDPCYHPKQRSLQRFIVSNDRGMHVRPFERYVDLCGEEFHEPKATFQNGHFPDSPLDLHHAGDPRRSLRGARNVR